MSSRRRPGARADFEEMRPNRFVIFNPALRPVLRGEGETEGDRFSLNPARREGLLGRLRLRNFLVITIEDLIEELPELPQFLGGPFVERELAQSERFSQLHYDPALALPSWRPLAAVGSRVQLPSMVAVQRRRGRGPSSYVRISPRGAIESLPEEQALLAAYSQLAASAPHPIRLQRTAEGGLVLPHFPLPPSHQSILGRLGSSERSGLHLHPEALPLLSDLLARLGLSLIAT